MIFETFALTWVPCPLVTEQLCPADSEPTVTLYPPNSATGVENVKDPLAESTSGSAALLSSVTSIPLASPVSVPPIVNVLAEHWSTILETFAVTPLPVPFWTVQVASCG